MSRIIKPSAPAANKVASPAASSPVPAASKIIPKSASPVVGAKSPALADKKPEEKSAAVDAKKPVVKKSNEPSPTQIYALEHLETFDDVEAVKEIWLSGKKLASIPDDFFEFTETHTVVLSSNYLYANQLEDVLTTFAKNLKNVDFSSNYIDSIPTVISSVANLTLLNLSNNSITQDKIPAALSQCKNLKQLNLSGNQIAFIPNVFPPSLESLNLENNLITDFPDFIFDLVNLKSLLLAHNQIASLPDRIGDLKQLETFTIHHNALSEIRKFPPSVVNIQLQANKFTNLDFLAQIKQAKSLNVSNNAIVVIPDEIASLSNLERLNFNSTAIAKLPAALQQLAKLEEVDLQDLTLLDDISVLYGIKSLKRINVSGTAIASIGPELAQLSNLEDLDANHCNNLKTLDKCVVSMPKLTSIGLKECYNLTEPSQNAAKAGHVAIIASLSGNEVEVPKDNSSSCLLQ